MLESGQTFAIGGLIQNTRHGHGSKKLPVLGELPFIGSGFSRVQPPERRRPNW